MRSFRLYTFEITHAPDAVAPAAPAQESMRSARAGVNAQPHTHRARSAPLQPRTGLRDSQTAQRGIDVAPHRIRKC